MFHKLKLTTLNPEFFFCLSHCFWKQKLTHVAVYPILFTELVFSTLYVFSFVILLETYIEKDLLCFYYTYVLMHLIHALKLKFCVNKICTGNCLYKNVKHVK